MPAAGSAPGAYASTAKSSRIPIIGWISRRTASPSTANRCAPPSPLTSCYTNRKGYLTTWRDPEGRPTVYDLARDAGTWLSPVGRLDLDTSGLLLLTNDTAFADRIADPDRKIPKTYQVKASTLLSDEQIEQLRRGVELSDGPTRPAQVKRLRDGPKHTHLEIIITEGRNRQVRRMLEAVDSKVSKLVRTAIGPLRIGDLPIGKWRPLTEGEVRELGGGARRPRGRHSELEYQRIPMKGAI